MGWLICFNCGRADWNAHHAAAYPAYENHVRNCKPNPKGDSPVSENDSKQGPENRETVYTQEVVSLPKDSLGTTDPVLPETGRPPLPPRQAPPGVGGEHVGKTETRRFSAQRKAGGWGVWDNEAMAWDIQPSGHRPKEGAMQLADACNRNEDPRRASAMRGPGLSQVEQIQRCLAAGGHFENCECPQIFPGPALRRRRTGWAYYWRFAAVLYLTYEAGVLIGRTFADWVTYEGDA